MSKPAVTYPDVENLVVDYLTDELDAQLSDATVAIGVPGDWHRSDPPHLQVSLDGTPAVDHPISERATVRLTAYADTTSASKALVNLACGLLCAHPGGDEIAATHKLTGVLPAHDDETGAELASVTVAVTVRSTPI